ncbi:Marvel domain-containing protein [Aphelenchoides besseyi]|nr:Marvel domain-containing protein [Aphelenchoides besseyi]
MAGTIKFAHPKADSRYSQSSAQQTSTVGILDCPASPDMNYLLSVEGLLKLLAIIFNFLCFLCTWVGGSCMFVGWVTTVATTGFIISTIFLCTSLFNVVDSFSSIPWIATEMVFCFVWTIFHFTAGSCLAFSAAYSSVSNYSWAIAAFFSFSAMLIYAFDCYLKLLTWRDKGDEEVKESKVTNNRLTNL